MKKVYIIEMKPGMGKSYIFQSPEFRRLLKETFAQKMRQVLVTF